VQVFRVFCEGLTSAGITDVLRIVNKGYKAGRHKSMVEDDESGDSDDDILEEDDENEGDLKIGDESNEVKEVATRISKTRSLETCHKCSYLNCCSLSCT
jgi:hypothetical protein